MLFFIIITLINHTFFGGLFRRKRGERGRGRERELVQAAIPNNNETMLREEGLLEKKFVQAECLTTLGKHSASRKKTHIDQTRQTTQRAAGGTLIDRSGSSSDSRRNNNR
jgi:hypothetical protein